jgi:hypothetical protein
MESAGGIIRVNGIRPVQRENLGQSQVRNHKVAVRIDQYIIWLDVPVNNPLAVQMINADELVVGQNTDLQNTNIGRILTSSAIYTRASSAGTPSDR